MVNSGSIGLMLDDGDGDGDDRLGGRDDDDEQDDSIPGFLYRRFLCSIAHLYD